MTRIEYTTQLRGYWLPLIHPWSEDRIANTLDKNDIYFKIETQTSEYLTRSMPGREEILFYSIRFVDTGWEWDTRHQWRHDPPLQERSRGSWKSSSYP